MPLARSRSASPSAWLLAIAIVAASIGPWPAAGEAAAPRQLVAALAMAWRLARVTDVASGRRSCSVVSLGDDVAARLAVDAPAATATWTVFVGFDNQPGSLRYLRIGKSVYTTDQPAFRGREAQAIVTGLSAPGVFAFEWAKRPDYGKRLGLFATGDFAARARECALWISGARI